MDLDPTLAPEPTVLKSEEPDRGRPVPVPNPVHVRFFNTKCIRDLLPRLTLQYHPYEEEEWQVEGPLLH